jgi:transcriptional regulator GlxA family with amidase domain
MWQEREETLKRIIFLTYEGSQLLDMAGPASVFTEANEVAQRPCYEVVVASPKGGLIASRGGVAFDTVSVLTLESQKTDTVIVSGGVGDALRKMLAQHKVAAWLQQAAKRTQRVASTCTGAFVLAAWGFLDGRRATTHWQAADALKAAYPLVNVDTNALFVIHGSIWTSAGVSTGIDMALAMLEHEQGRELAAAVAQRLVLQMKRPGHQSQFSTLLHAQGGPYAKLIQWMSENLNADLSLETLASRANQSTRTFCRRFTVALGVPPGAYVERLRLERARALLDTGELAKTVATEAGFSSLNHLWRAFNRTYALNPSAYRAIHAQTRRSGPGPTMAISQSV